MRPKTLLVAFFLAISASACRGSKEPGHDLFGCWQDPDPARSVLVRFQPARCFLFEDGNLVVSAVTYQPGKIVLASWGKTFTWDVQTKGDALTLRSVDGKIQLSFRRLDGVPPELELRPLPLGQAGELPPEKVQAIQDELAQRKKVDQEVRVENAPGVSWTKVDADNTAYLIKLVQEIGWIDATRFGPQAAGSAFLIAQHSGYLSLVLAAYPEVEKDAKAGRISLSYFASMHDRLHILLCEPQRYGSQLGENDKGEMVVLPLEDRSSVDELRKQLGLTPLEEYLDYMKKKNGWKEVKFVE